MVKVIETNLSFSADGAIYSFQSRVIEVESWMSFVLEIVEENPVNRTSYIGSLMGESFNRGTKTENFKADDKCLSYDFTNRAGIRMKKLAYLISQ